MIDIHCHILPGIDDGAVELAESVAMCRRAAAAGCEALIATPHQRHPTWWNAEVRKLEVLLHRIRDEIGDQPRLYLGGEVRIDQGFAKELDDLTNAGILSLAGSSYLLIEFERRQLSVEPVAVVEEITAAGWFPIVAHPEFIPGLRENLELARQLVEAGALMQITGMSVTGQFGDQSRVCAEALLDAGLAHFVASDAHGVESRRPGLKRARRVIARSWGEKTADRLTHTNPQAVIENRRIPPVKPGAPVGVAVH